MRHLRSILVACTLIASTAHAYAADPIALERARLTISDATTPPTTAGQSVDMPFVPRNRENPLQWTAGWFRFDVEPPTRSETLALLLPRYNVAVDIYFNDAYVGGTPDGGRFDRTGWNHPLLVTIRPSELRERNHFDVRLEGGLFGGMMARPLFGTHAALAPLHEARRFWQVETSRWAFALSLVMAALTLLLWRRRRQDRMYLLFAGSCLSWAGITLMLFIEVVPISLPVWLACVHTCASWCAWFLVKFVFAAIDRPQPRFERALLWIVIVATVAHFVTPPTWFFQVTYGLHLITVSAVLGTGGYLLADSLRRPGGLTSWFALGYLGMAGLVAHDWYYFMVSSDESYAQASSMTHLGVPLLLVILFMHLVDRFAGALDASESLNADLERRVEASRRALEASFEETRAQELLRTAAEERAQIYRDLHDDVGARLVNIVHGAESREIAQLARSALESLRAAIYRAEHGRQSVEDFLVELETEFELRCRRAELALRWYAAEPAHGSAIPSTTAYHLTRVLRELLSNVMQHAHASEVEVVIALEHGVLEIVVSDDGTGMCPDEAHGNGLANVQERMALIRGEVTWRPRPGGGTAVLLSCSLEGDGARPGDDSAPAPADALVAERETG